MFAKDGFLIRALKLAYICNGVIPPENAEEDVCDPKREIARDMVHQMLRGSCSMEEFLNLLRGNSDAE